MRRFFTITFVLNLLIMVSISAQKSFGLKMSPERYVEWYRANLDQFQEKIVQNGFEYTLTFVPTEVQLIRYSNNRKMTKEEVNEFLKTFEKGIDFRLSINSLENGRVEFLKSIGTNDKTYEDRIKYYSFELQHDIRLVEGDSEFAATDYIFERSFDIKPNGNIQFSFNREKLKENSKIIIEDNGFSESLIEFSFSSKTLNKRPKLKYSKIWKR
jgi:hypothetical protein